MNKKLIFVLILFLPAIVAGVWFLSATGDVFTVSNVTSVAFVCPDGTSTEYTSDDDKELYVEFHKNIVSIDAQQFDPEVYSLYQLTFSRVKGDDTYYLCLSADTKNCLAYDEKGNWYRIDKEYAQRFLTLNSITDVYKNSEVPVLSFTSNGVTTSLASSTAKWFYLLADGSYAEVTVNDNTSILTDVCVISGDGFDFDFDISPDWFDIKIYDNDVLIYDGMLDSVAELSDVPESQLRAVIEAEWYEESNNYYHGEATYDFLFDYDVKATYTLSEASVNSGEALYIKLFNADNEQLEITTTLSGAEQVNAHSINEGKLIVIPVPMTATAGEYRVNVKSDKTSLSIPFTVREKDFGTVNVGFVASEGAEEYANAQTLFKDEISSAFSIVLGEAYWTNGLLVPIQKFLNGEEQYWVSSPPYGSKQKINGTEIDERSFGIHYVKSVAAQSMPVRAVAKGNVAFAGTTSLYGNTIIIEHGFGLKSVYGHLDAINFKVGDSLEQGTVLAGADPASFAIASTECFFGICIDGVFLNPYSFIIEPRSSDAAEISEPIEFFAN